MGLVRGRVVTLKGTRKAKTSDRICMHDVTTSVLLGPVEQYHFNLQSPCRDPGGLIHAQSGCVHIWVACSLG